MTSKERIEKAWELVNSKHIETNDEIQLVRYAVRTARELAERDTPMKPLLVEVNANNVHHYECLYCGATINIGGSIAYNKAFNIFCRECGQRLDWSERYGI